MGDLTRRQKQRLDLQRKILTAAEELFARHGPEQVSMRKIASRIEYSPTTIYRFFPSKEDLLNRVIRDGYDRLYKIYDEITHRREISPLEALKQIVIAYIRFGLDNPNHYELWFRTSRIKVKGHDLHMTHGPSTYRVYRIHCWYFRHSGVLFTGRSLSESITPSSPGSRRNKPWT